MFQYKWTQVCESGSKLLLVCVKSSAVRPLTAFDKNHVLNVTVALVSDCRSTCMMFAIVVGSRSSRTKVVCVDLRGPLWFEFNGWGLSPRPSDCSLESRCDLVPPAEVQADEKACSGISVGKRGGAEYGLWLCVRVWWFGLEAERDEDDENGLGR